MLIWGTKASKKLARKYLTTRRKKKWSHIQFDSVDWEHLDLALKSKEDMNKIWRSKQHLGFCGTRVQVGRYSGELLPDKRCPNCGRQETVAHLMLCPADSRTHLVVKQSRTWSSGCQKIILPIWRSCTGSQNLFSWEEASHLQRWGLCLLSSKLSPTAMIS